MTQAVSRDELEAQFSGRVTLVAALLEDLAKCVPAAVTLAEDATLEDAFELHDSNARSVRQIFLDSTEALEDSDALRKEMKTFSETLDQGSLATFQKWFDLINKATRWDASLRTVRKQRREHNTIMAKAKQRQQKQRGNWIWQCQFHQLRLRWSPIQFVQKQDWLPSKSPHSTGTIVSSSAIGTSSRRLSTRTLG